MEGVRELRPTHRKTGVKKYGLIHRHTVIYHISMYSKF